MSKLTVLFITATILMAPVAKVNAAGLLPECDMSGKTTGTAGRPCTLDDFLVLAINLINYMLAISGSLALLFFVYGGFTWLIAAGNSEKISKGKEILTSAAVGVLVVLASWMIVNFVYTTLIEGGKPWITKEQGKDSVQREWWKNN